MLNKDQLDLLNQIPAQTLLYEAYTKMDIIASEMCDHYCKYPYQDVCLDDICAACPLNKLLEE